MLTHTVLRLLQLGHVLSVATSREVCQDHHLPYFLNEFREVKGGEAKLRLDGLDLISPAISCA